LPKKSDTTEFGVLNGVTLNVRPGSSTLVRKASLSSRLVVIISCNGQVLGNPGSGKSSLLKLIAGKVPTKFLDGEILVNGENTSSWHYKLDNIAKYVEQEERHLPLLTVRETLEYAETFQREVPVASHCVPRVFCAL
jgi:ABC-type branched-subunit amino acid transport system ATPase component